ncbi:MAG: electron transport complex subunit RsxC [Firmicutes bacterium]|nr:electron transport complex subunit RsxC [Bacillota bacterium]
MTVKTFSRGVFLPHYKEFSENKSITAIPLPKEVVIPLHQHTGAPCRAVVKPGDEVKAGQRIGESDAFVTAFIHASVDGKVKAVEPRPYFTGTNVESVVIEVDAKQGETAWQERDVSKLNIDQIKDAIKNAGIVGMGGAAFPTHVKLSPPTAIDAFIVNACECEPFLTCDHRMMVEMTDALIAGARLIQKVVSAPRVIFGVETNKPDAIQALNAKIAGETGFQVVPLDVKYPQGSEKQLIKAVCDREVPPGKLPFDVGVVVQNVATCIAVYDACRYDKPLIERVLTVTGDAAARPQNILARIGTPISHIIEHCGGFKGEAGKVIMGGPMTGWAQTRLDIPIVKGTSGILLFSQAMVAETQHMACVRCGKCVDHCPMFLYPNYIGTYAETGRFDLAAEWGAMVCFECGVCVYVCPSNRPIVQFVREAKRQIAAARAAKN